MKPVVASLLTVGLLISGTLLVHAPAQGQSIEKLERDLQRAREEKARRDAVAARAREEAESDRRRREAEASRAEAERKAQEARLATVVVQTDAPCALTMNGDPLGLIQPGISKHRVPPGQKLVSCASNEERTAFDGELDARSGQEVVLRITLAGKVAGIRADRAAALERDAQAKRETEARARVEAERMEKEAEARARVEAKRMEKEAQRIALQRQAVPAMTARLQAVSDTVLFDAQQGLQWTRSDNNSDVNRSEAQSHCRSLGGGWSLPTVAQLQSLYDRNLPGVKCGKSTCEVSDQFRLSDVWFWSSEPNGSSDAWLVILGNGDRFSYLVGLRNSLRALCVRRP